MKKTIALITILVLILSCTSILFVACDKDEDKVDTSKNSDTLVSAAVMSASMMSPASSAAEEESGSFKAGLDLTLSFNGTEIPAPISTIATPLMDTVVDVMSGMIDDILDRSVNMVSASVGNNSVKIEKSADEENVYFATIKTVVEDNEEAKEVEKKFKVTIDIADGATIDSEEFTYTLKVELLVGENYQTVLSTSGSAKYSEAKKAIEFIFGEDGSKLSAYATQDGAINIELAIDTGETLKAGVVISIKNGVANVDLNAELAGYGKVNANINVGIGADFKQFAISGTFNGTVITPEIVITSTQSVCTLLGITIPQSFNAEGNISGIAQFNVDDEEFEIGLAGNIALSFPTEE